MLPIHGVDLGHQQTYASHCVREKCRCWPPTSDARCLFHALRLQVIIALVTQVPGSHLSIFHIQIPMLITNMFKTYTLYYNWDNVGCVMFEHTGRIYDRHS